MAASITTSDIFAISLYPRDSEDSDQWPKLSCSEANQLNITDTTNLTVNGAIAATALSVTGTVTADAFEGDGSALTGKVSTAGDTMTGPLTIDADLTVNGAIATNKLNVTDSVTEPLTIDANLTVSNNVGIGTKNPEHNLQIGNAANAVSLSLRGPDGHTQANIIAFEDNLGTGGRWLRLIHDTQSNALKITSTEVDPIATFSRTTGNVGIGTASPQSKLHVNGDTQIGRLILNAVGLESSGLLRLKGAGFVFTETDWNLLLGNLCTVGSNLEVQGDLDVDGNLYVSGSKSGYITDRFINQSGDLLEQGDVVILGENSAEVCYGLDDNIPVPGVDLTTTAYDRRACGIVSEILIEKEVQLPNAEAIAQNQAEPLGKAINVYRDKRKQLQVFSAEEIEKLDRKKVGWGQFGNMVTLGCFAHCKVDADVAPIAVGDLLTTSPTKGHAQKVLDLEKATGAIIGKALKSLEKGKGKIPVLVMLH